MYDGSDTIVLYEELAYQDMLPVAWRPLPDSLDADLSAAFSDANVRVLQSCAAIEEHGHVEKPDENAPHAADLLRIDLKINVLLDLVGRLLAQWVEPKLRVAAPVGPFVPVLWTVVD